LSWRRVLARLIAGVPALLVVTVLVFAIVRLIPGDPARILAGDFATDQVVRELRERWQLDRPLPIQYAAYLGGLLRGDLGRSTATSLPVAADLGERFLRRAGGRPIPDALDQVVHRAHIAKLPQRLRGRLPHVLFAVAQRRDEAVDVAAREQLLDVGPAEGHLPLPPLGIFPLEARAAQGPACRGCGDGRSSRVLVRREAPTFVVFDPL